MVVRVRGQHGLRVGSRKANVRFFSGMPRVSQAHLDARRRQILDASRRCFINNGFHATSMQDILREADMSAGAVYRYFRGKDDIIAAIGSDALGEFTAAFDSVLGNGASSPLDGALGQMLDVIHRLDATQDVAKLILTVWGEGARSPELSRFFAATFDQVRRLVVRAVEEQQEVGLLPGDASADGVARVLIGMLHGYVIQLALLGDADAAEFRSGLSVILGGVTPEPRSHSM
ncbi:TetR/AcrR family transcriptional regulator [Streptomyces sp. NBC_01221]|uniref:TetR/AcrR family transcriptional regulator n=1 Tax=unclassified Streptomyces TaxID=2593676 RepID=UPI0022515F49|nr:MULTISPECIES: TetR/AcrR family transcriptional regulator [unclassified Streptomyces]MCX4789564.1 TetR/AcrR family transcriptional regulator [Streptomyces sp. NBC_01221]WSJ36037.1 TetR/AcrR family transcriptional regulator [Streptomyces sp. NBC_01321]